MLWRAAMRSSIRNSFICLGIYIEVPPTAVTMMQVMGEEVLSVLGIATKLIRKDERVGFNLRNNNGEPAIHYTC